MRKENQEDFQNRFGIKLGFMSFFVKACVLGLKSFPSINAEVDGEEIIYKNYYNISFAVGTDKGLVVPVLKNSDELSFADIEKNIKSISEKARDGKLTIEDLARRNFYNKQWWSLWLNAFNSYFKYTTIWRIRNA